MNEHRVALRVAGWVLSKDRPDDQFGGVFFDIRKQTKDLKEKLSQEARTKLEGELQSDLSSKGAKVLSLQVSLGQYRGSRFVTSAKLKVQVKDEETAKRLLSYLQKKWSPKFKLKKFESNVVDYNIR